MGPTHHNGTNDLGLLRSLARHGRKYRADAPRMEPPPQSPQGFTALLTAGCERHPRQARAVNSIRDGGDVRDVRDVGGSITHTQGKLPAGPTSNRGSSLASHPHCPQIPTFLQQQPQLRGRGRAQDSPCTFPRLICGFHICFFCLEEAFREATQPGLLTVFVATQGFKISTNGPKPVLF